MDNRKQRDEFLNEAAQKTGTGPARLAFNDQPAGVQKLSIHSPGRRFVAGREVDQSPEQCEDKSSKLKGEN